MKTKIVVSKKDNCLYFYLVENAERIFLFTQSFTKGVYNFFRFGKAESEIKSFNKWNDNPRLDKTIEKIPIYTRYVRKNIMYL